MPTSPTTSPPHAIDRLLASRWVRHGLMVLAFNSVMSVLMALQSGKPWPLVWVHAQCIGLTIWLLVEPLATWLDRRGVSSRALWLLLVPACVVVGYLLGHSLADVLLGRPGWQLRNGVGPEWFKEGSLSLMAGVSATAFFFFRHRLAHIRAEAEAARRLAAESQLRLLQAQLEPHMLFNTLANLRALIGLDATQAQAMLDRLIAFLRATLSASRQSAHPLADEFARLADYLALMQVRMGPRLQTRLDLPEALRDWHVPPLLLQPLVENAIRHGLEPKREGGMLSVCATLDGERLCLTVRDTGLGLVKAVQDGHTGGPSALTGTGTGFGLTQVRERLATTWGEQATFTLVPAAEGGAVATLRLPRLPVGTGS